MLGSRWLSSRSPKEFTIRYTFRQSAGAAAHARSVVDILARIVTLCSMKLEQTTAELYALDPAEFVAARDEAARTARADGDKQLATAISRLRRPTVAAWAVNLLAHKATQELGALLDLGEALREAQRTLSADRMRTLADQRRKAVNALTDKA